MVVVVVVVLVVVVVIVVAVALAASAAVILEEHNFQSANLRRNTVQESLNLHTCGSSPQRRVAI